MSLPLPEDHPRSRALGTGSSDQRWTWLFAGLVAVALPLLLFHYGEYHWFHRDEWHVLAGRGDGFPDLLEPHGGVHWIAVPRLIYLALWQVVGLNTYRPYQAVVVIMHLGVAVLLRSVMRRAEVRSSLATAAAAVFVLCGPGAVNTVWAFQMSFIGSVAWGLGHLLLADHDGPCDRRDALGLALGLLAIASSAVGITMTVAVGVAVLLRRGWRPAALHTLPLAVVYLAWMEVGNARSSNAFGRPSARQLLDWVLDAGVGTFVALGHFAPLGWVLFAVGVAGLVLIAQRWRASERGEERRRLAMPIGLALAALFFTVTTGLERFWLGADGPTSPRFIYLTAALVLPLLAVAAEAVARRHRVLVAPLVVLFLVPIPFNLARFEPGLFGRAYMEEQQQILTTAVRVSFARDVPGDVEPVQPRPVASALDSLTIGFLLGAEDDGKLTPSTAPLAPEDVNELRVRLGVAQRTVRGQPVRCRQEVGPIELDPAVGDRIQLKSPVAVTTVDDGRPSSRPIVFLPGGLNGTELTIELADLHLELRPARGATAITICDDRFVPPRP